MIKLGVGNGSAVKRLALHYEILIHAPSQALIARELSHYEFLIHGSPRFLIHPPLPSISLASLASLF